MTFRVMAGISAIWAGNTRELKDGAFVMTGPYYIASFSGGKEYCMFYGSGRCHYDPDFKRMLIRGEF